MNEQIKAGGDIHAGDGGYSIGTKEKYDEFVKIRNKSLAEARIQRLKQQAGIDDNPDQEGLNLFAELLVLECAGICEKDGRWWAEKGYLMEAGEAGYLATQIREHFGVE